MEPDDMPPHPDREVPCPTCGQLMAFTGLPDLAGPVYFRFYRCPDHGVVRIDANPESPEGWG